MGIQNDTYNRSYYMFFAKPSGKLNSEANSRYVGKTGLMNMNMDNNDYFFHLKSSRQNTAIPVQADFVRPSLKLKKNMIVQVEENVCKLQQPSTSKVLLLTHNENAVYPYSFVYTPK